MPRSAVKVLPADFKHVGHVWCARRGATWLPGRRIAKVWFVGFQAEAKRLTRRARHAHGTAKLRLNRRARKLRQRSKSAAAACNPTEGPADQETGQGSPVQENPDSQGSPDDPASAAPAPTDHGVQASGTSFIGTEFTITVSQSAAGVASGHARFANPKYVKPVRDGDVSCANVVGHRAVFGIADTAAGGLTYREFYIEQSADGLRLTELAHSDAPPRKGCDTPLPPAGSGDPARSGEATFT